MGIRRKMQESMHNAQMIQTTEPELFNDEMHIFSGATTGRPHARQEAITCQLEIDTNHPELTMFGIPLAMG